ncbi:hypothetical protein [Allorhizobium taibaishanense]|uniref:Uncharacterized protein n=1 Tax=Allorhizobium taibaishanense TaxID=887144 RepID=A0A1Q9A7F9_9HYPH|nr:hypothetical protein [Allorhizobium taibaishanense]MBB4008304.1 hypothetical protein [Allorhizobium taibaishanense]OLP50505.1 hypothetical protein BJF91_14585 [Allorhizobium taibaishanense]
MTVREDLAELLARAFWSRSVTEAERLAMQAEIARDARAIGIHSYGRDGGLFSVEPSHFQGLMLREIKGEP